MKNIPAKDAKPGVKRARGIDRLIDILKYLNSSGRPQRPNEIAAGIDAPKSSVYEIVNRLVEERVLEQYDTDGRLYLGRTLHFWGARYLEKFDLLRQADPVVAALSEDTGETAQLCMIDGNKFVVALAHSGARHFSITSELGRPVPLTWTASGRLLVSNMSDEDIIKFIPDEDFILPNGSDMPKATFLREVADANAVHFYSCDSIIDKFTKCYAAAVRDQSGTCLATLCLVLPRDDAKPRHNELRNSLIGFASKLTNSLGGTYDRNTA